MPSSQTHVNGHKRALPASRAKPRKRPQEQPSSGGSVIKAAASALVSAGSAQSRTQAAIADHRRQAVGHAHRVRDMLQGASKLVPDNDTVLSYLQRAGQHVEDVASYIEGVDLGKLRSDVQRLARERPGLFVGGALVAGLAIGRLLKAVPHGSTEIEIEVEEEGDE
jgi:hypothetical protein